jgi:hypothetical protein
MCSGQCDQANCRMKLGKLGLSSTCLWRCEGRGSGLISFSLGHCWRRRDGLACSYQHTKQSHDF